MKMIVVVLVLILIIVVDVESSVHGIKRFLSSGSDDYNDNHHKHGKMVIARKIKGCMTNKDTKIITAKRKGVDMNHMKMANSAAPKMMEAIRIIYKLIQSMHIRISYSS